MPRIHHTALTVADVDRSLVFWRDGLGFEVLMDQSFAGDWPTLLRAPTTQLRSVFLGDPHRPDAGIVELVDLGAVPVGPAPAEAATTGFLLVSITADVATTLDRLASLGVGGEPRRIEAMGVAMAVVTDPDGVLVELIDSPAADDLAALTTSDDASTSPGPR